MKEWTYLTSNPFEARYAIAAHYLQQTSRRVLEVGGYKNPLDSFAWSTCLESITVVDPLIQPKDVYIPRCNAHLTDCHVLHIPSLIEKFQVEENYDGFLCLGMHLFDKALARCISIMEGVAVAVIGIPTDFPPSVDNLETILKTGKFTKVITVDLDLSANDYKLPSNSFPVRPYRRLVVLKPVQGVEE